MKYKTGSHTTYKRPVFKRTPDMKNEVWAKTGGKCFFCKCDLLPYGGKKNSFSIDHFIPLRNGGTDDLENLVPACKSCNCKKGAR